MYNVRYLGPIKIFLIKVKIVHLDGVAKTDKACGSHQATLASGPKEQPHCYSFVLSPESVFENARYPKLQLVG